MGKIWLYAAKVVVWYHFNGLEMQKKPKRVLPEKKFIIDYM